MASARSLELVEQYTRLQEGGLREQLQREFHTSLAHHEEECEEPPDYNVWSVRTVLACLRNRLLELLDVVDELFCCPEPVQHYCTTILGRFQVSPPQT